MVRLVRKCNAIQGNGDHFEKKTMYMWVQWFLTYYKT